MQTVWTATDQTHQTPSGPYTYTHLSAKADHGLVDEYNRAVGGRAWAYVIDERMGWGREHVGEWYAGVQATRNGASYGASQSGAFYATEAAARAAVEAKLDAQRKSYIRKYGKLLANSDFMAGVALEAPTAATPATAPRSKERMNAIIPGAGDLIERALQQATAGVRGARPAQESNTMKTTAPKCAGSLAPLPPHTKTFQAATSKRAICPVCGGRIGLVQPKEGGLKYSTHYRKGHQEASGSGARSSGRPAAKQAAKAARPKGTPRAELSNGSAAKFITASGTEYAFIRDPDSDGKSRASGVAKVPDSKAAHGHSEYPVFVNDAGEASFRNVRQGRLVRGRIA